jgi:hypothetical protein
MSKMGSHDPFGYLKHKLCPKERLGIKVPIWLPTTRSQESPWFTCVQMTCYILLKISWQGLQLCFKTHLNQRSTQEVMGFQSYRGPNFGTPNLGVPKQNDIWVKTPWPGIENIIKGKVVASRNLGHGESHEFVFAHGLSVHQKCSNYALTNLLFGLCRFVWIINLLVIRPNPHPGVPSCPSTPELLWAKTCSPTLYPSIVFTFGLVIESIKEFGGVSFLLSWNLLGFYGIIFADLDAELEILLRKCAL